MTDAEKSELLRKYFRAPEHEKAAAWAALHAAGMVSEREPTDDDLPLLAATTHKEAA